MLYFVDFQSFVEFVCEMSPVMFFAVFAMNCIFGIFADLDNFGGDN